MNWTEITIEIPVTQSEQAAAIAQMTVPYGIYIEDYSDLEIEVPRIAHVDLIDETLLAKNRSIALIHIYISPDENPLEALSFLKIRLSDEGIPFTIATKNVKEQDWAAEWKKYYKPIRVGQSIVVTPSWETYIPLPKDVVVTLDPGMAFGTGTHATTRLCMELLETCTFPHCSVLDIGTGSGILAVTALLLGAKAALGIDIDELAIRTAGENAVLNHVDNRFEARYGDLSDGINGPYDIVIANIVADVIIRLAPCISSLLAETGVFIASGIIDTREEDVRDAIHTAGLAVTGVKYESGWVALLIKKSSDA